MSIDAGEPSAQLRMVELSAVFMLVTFGVFAAYGLCAAGVGDRVAARTRVLTRMRRLFAASFLALGARLAITER